MSNLEGIYNRILEALHDENEERKKKLISITNDIKMQQEIQKYAVKQGDLSENAEYKEATEALQELSVTKAYVEECISIYDNFDGIKHVLATGKGTHYIDLKSVVTVSRKDTGETASYMIVPAGISNIEIGAISERCPVGQELLGKVSGSTIHINVKGKLLTYTVKEVY